MNPFLIDFRHAERPFKLTIENNGESCWAYLTDTEAGKLLKDVFVFSPINPLVQFDKESIERGNPPKLIKKYASSSAYLSAIQAQDFNVVWSEKEDSLVILYLSEPIAAIYQSEKMGFSKSLIGSSGFGEAWDQKLFEQHFDRSV